MLLEIRETEAMPPLPEALPAGANSKRCHSPPSYQNASPTEPLAPTHHTPMLLGIRETAVIPPFSEALPAGANSKPRHPPGICTPSIPNIGKRLSEPSASRSLLVSSIPHS